MLIRLQRVGMMGGPPIGAHGMPGSPAGTPREHLEPISFLSFSIDRRGGRLTRAGEPLPLRPKTWSVLLYLAERPGVLVGAQELLDAVWPDVAVTPDTLRKSIGELRVALEDNSKTPRCIETVHRRGFRFIAATRALGSLPSAVEDSDASRQPRPADLFVGRTAELERLRLCLAKAQAGQRQLVFVTGPAGVGKTALVETFLDAILASSTAVRVGRGACIDQHGAREPYMPVLEALERFAREDETDQTVDLLRRVGPAWLAQMPWLVDELGPSVPQPLPGARAERMLREIAAFTEAAAEKATTVLVLEDLHWSDASTVDLLSYLAQRREPARLLVVGTYRPADIAVYDHALADTVRRLKMQRQCLDLAVHELSGDDVQSYLEARFPGSRFPPALTAVLHRHTDGNPLFMAAVIDHMLARGLILDTSPGWALTVALDQVDLGIPEDVRQMVVTQLETLMPADREVLEAASVGGIEFAVQATAMALRADIDAVESRCETLARAHRFLQAAGSTEWPDGSVARRYAFIHELYRQAVYREIPDGRRRKLHQSIGEALEAAHAEHATEIASMLAMHFARSRDHARAAHYLAAAATRACRRYALREAIDNLDAAITHAERLPDEDDRRRLELALRLKLLPLVSDFHGFASERLLQTCTRAHELCSQAGTPEQQFVVTYALAHVHSVRGDKVLAPQTAGRLTELAGRMAGDNSRLIADSMVMRNAIHDGAFIEACRVADEQLPLPADKPVRVPGSFGADPLVAVRCHYAFARWMLGYADDARRTARAALARADEYGLPFTSAATLWFNGIIELFCRNPAQAAHFADRCLALCDEHGFAFWHAMACAVKGWTRVQDGQLRQGIEELEAAHAALNATGAQVFRTHILAFLAEAHLRSRSYATGLASIDEALDLAETTLDRSFWPELWRLKGELLLAADCPAYSEKARSKHGARQLEAEQCLTRAVEMARASQAQALELRALTSLTRAPLAPRQSADIARRLQQLCDRLGSGGDSPDLEAARAVLGERSAHSPSRRAGAAAK